MRASLLAIGGNRREMLARVAAFVADFGGALGPTWNTSAKPRATIRLACSRTIGPLGYVLVHLDGPDDYVRLLLDYQESLRDAIVEHCSPSRTDIQELQVLASASSLLESERSGQQRFDFQFEHVEEGTLANVVSTACKNCKLNIVAHDGILRPIISPYARPLPRYRQLVTGYVDTRLRSRLTTSEFAAALNAQLSQHQGTTAVPNARRDPVHLMFESRKYGETLDPKVFDIRFAGFHDGPYVYLVMTGPDRIGMVAAGSSYLLRQQSVANAASNFVARAGIVRCSSRSMGGLAIVVMCAAWPTDMSSDAAIQNLGQYLVTDGAMRSLRDQGVQFSFFVSRVPPWSSNHDNDKLVLQAESSDQRGRLVQFCEVLRKSAFAKEYDIAEFDGRLANYREVARPDHLRFIAGLLLDPRANWSDAKMDLSDVLTRAGYAVSYRHIGTEISDASWDLVAH